MLKVNNVEVRYGGIILALRGISLELNDRAMVAVLGANGAGKSTTLKAISGLLRTEMGEVTAGSIEFNGVRIDRKGPEEIARMGIVQVVEGRQVLEHLSTEENLLAGTLIHRHNGAKTKRLLDMVYDYFPKLKDLRHQTSGYLSGGEQQMLVIGRVLMTQPQVMLLDEPSLGLGPLLVKEIFEILPKVNAEEGTAILLVEQNVQVALSIADYGYIMENGRFVLEGASAMLQDNEDVQKFYIGLSELGERKSYREVKYYKTRSRWRG